MLLKNALRERDAWEKSGYTLPAFDREKMIEKTLDAPTWVHFGAGNIFRAFQAHAQQALLDRGLAETGILAAEGYDAEIVEKVCRPTDDLSLLATLHADGSVDKTVIASVAKTFTLEGDDMAAMRAVFAKPSLQMATFTITEKGYAVPETSPDFTRAPEEATSYLGRVTALVYARYQAGRLPLALVSMDNCSHNGEKLQGAVLAYARAWVAGGFVPEAFLAYLTDGTVTFPWTMIDKITPRPDPEVQALFEKDGVEGLAPIVTAKHSYAAPFVNAEESEYLVIEDAFPNGGPPLEEAGFLFTDRETVNRVERMKVCTCLNPLHTALAIFGCLLGFSRICQEMEDADLSALARGLGYVEGLPVVTDPGVMNPKDFLDAVVKLRLPNPFMPDTPQRIATDTSQKLAIRFGETVKAYLASDTLDVQSLRLIPLVYAGWLRYLQGKDDEGRDMPLSPDPLLEKVCPMVQAGEIVALLRDETIFGLDLEKAGLTKRVRSLYEDLCAGSGAVRRTLHRVVTED